MITATLAPDAPLRAVFKDGTVPLSRPSTVRAKLGGADAPETVYLIALRQCTKEQLDGMAEMMAAMGQGTKAEAEKFLAEAPEVPLREKMVSSVGIPLRAFI